MIQTVNLSTHVACLHELRDCIQSRSHRHIVSNVTAYNHFLGKWQLPYSCLTIWVCRPVLLTYSKNIRQLQIVSTN